MRLVLEALLDEVPGLGGELDMVMPVDLGGADLLVGSVGDVATEHVVQQDTQGPHRQAVSSIFSQLNPFRRRVDSGASELSKDFILLCLIIVEASGAKVNQLCLHGVHVH